MDPSFRVRTYLRHLQGVRFEDVARRIGCSWRALVAHRRRVGVAVGCGLAQGLLAANAVLYYSRDLLTRAGVADPLDAELLVGCIKLLGVVNAEYPDPPEMRAGDTPFARLTPKFTDCVGRSVE